MQILRRAKLATLSAARATGLFEGILESGWRRKRLMILGYHGISICDEHDWRPELYMSLTQFEQRMEMLRRRRCSVLGLGEAVERLGGGNLPRRAVVLTFDDGSYDFYRQVYPVLQAHGYPATLYLTTYYCLFNKPVFPVACAYMLWKSRGTVVSADSLLGGGGRLLDLRTETSRAAALRSIAEFASFRKLDGRRKDELLERLARLLEFDYASFHADRLLHLVNPQEAAEMAARGIDIQLHTHRHRVPAERDLFVREIEDNRRAILEMTGIRPTHFCYPSGIHRMELLPWLADLGVRSAVTCDHGLAGPHSGVLLLPRIIDTSCMPSIEFEGWLAGVRQWLPVRKPVQVN